ICTDLHIHYIIIIHIIKITTLFPYTTLFRSNYNQYIKGQSNNYFYWDKTAKFNNVKIYQRNDIIDPNKKDAVGRTNLDRMNKGLAPLGPDGKSINLHHMTKK